ncbi:hypothetical protein K438DRAFT_1768770 [Mycena galopus ATCC 62051]|nr:hypothetical protein K438DRAFT_1768770 [Mycena galopus ATCC 62051]
MARMVAGLTPIWIGDLVEQTVSRRMANWAVANARGTLVENTVKYQRRRLAAREAVAAPTRWGHPRDTRNPNTKRFGQGEGEIYGFWSAGLCSALSDLLHPRTNSLFVPDPNAHATRLEGHPRDTRNPNTKRFGQGEEEIYGFWSAGLCSTLSDLLHPRTNSLFVPDLNAHNKRLEGHLRDTRNPNTKRFGQGEGEIHGFWSEGLCSTLSDLLHPRTNSLFVPDPNAHDTRLEGHPRDTRNPNTKRFGQGEGEIYGFLSEGLCSALADRLPLRAHSLFVPGPNAHAMRLERHPRNTRNTKTKQVDQREGQGVRIQICPVAKLKIYEEAKWKRYNEEIA